MGCETEVRARPEGGGVFAPAVEPLVRLWRNGGGSGANRAASGPEEFDGKAAQ